MRVFEFIVVVVALAFAFSAFQTWLKAKAKAAERREPDEETETRLTAMEERLRVLERIVTDGREDLRRQFEDLEKKE